MTDERLRLGIVGLGNVGNYHAERLAALPGVTLRGGMDIDPAARERFADRFGVRTYEDHEALFETVEAAIVTTPNRHHEPYATAALEAGLDTLVEKPLAHTVESAERIVAAARGTDAVCMVGFKYRFLPPVEVLIARRDKGDLGTIDHVEANYVRRRGIPGRGSWFTDRATAGGGALVDIGAHVIDLALWIADYPEVVEVSGSTRQTFGDREEYAYLEAWGEEGGGDFDVEDGASAFLRCGDGTTVSLEVAWAANGPENKELLVHGRDQGARLNHDSGALTLYGAGTDGAANLSDTEIRTRDPDPIQEEQRHFVAAARGGRATKINTVEQALVVQQVIDAIYRSDDHGSAVTLDSRSRS